MTLNNVRQFRIQKDDMSDTIDAVQSAGQDGYELFVLWTGHIEDEVFVVDAAHAPAQTTYKLESGLCVTVDGEELHALNMWLYQARQILGAQVHSHPTTAYHSPTDDAYPIATQEGSLSVVLPHFGRDGWGSPGIAAYRLVSGSWRKVFEPLESVIEVVPNGDC